MKFRSVFNGQSRSRDKFLSRVLGIFSEEIARIWFGSEKSPYLDLGRPTIYDISPGKKHYTLDFTLQSKTDKKLYISEMKCEFEYENYKYLTLTSCEQLKHHKGRAFKIFLDIAKQPNKYKIRINGKPNLANGSILVWGSVTHDGVDSVRNNFSIYDILSLEEMINDLISIENKQFIDLISNYKMWCQFLFEHLEKNPT